MPIINKFGAFLIVARKSTIHVGTSFHIDREPNKRLLRALITVNPVVSPACQKLPFGETVNHVP